MRFLNLGSEVQVPSGTPFEIRSLIKNRRRGEMSVDTRDSGKADWSPDREREASARGTPLCGQKARPSRNLAATSCSVIGKKIAAAGFGPPQTPVVSYNRDCS
jgi:hypothetical protein